MEGRPSPDEAITCQVERFADKLSGSQLWRIQDAVDAAIEERLTEEVGDREERLEIVSNIDYDLSEPSADYGHLKVVYDSESDNFKAISEDSVWRKAGGSLPVMRSEMDQELVEWLDEIIMGVR